MDKINRRMGGNTWRRVINAWPTNLENGKEMRHDHYGRKDNRESQRHDHGMGRKLFVYNMKFGDTPPRRHFNKETGKYYYGRKDLGKVVNAEVS